MSIYHQNEIVEIKLVGNISFCPARILEVIGQHHLTYRVQYLARFSDEASTLPLIEELPILYLRPTPPELNDRNFVVNDLVDAYRNGNWHKGIISDIAAGPIYCVVLPIGVVFTDRVRFHADWSAVPAYMIPSLTISSNLPEVIIRYVPRGNGQ
ncbi:uncharacterized protein LOC126674505 [Mercurialis annua]|uniref:uncharacterized protein LOC126674505 n=1 Tax=Mercurialis annua TaxID=3986 RepID=UPI00215FFE4B|nr:uncharacterized protein LOC126674505 [Mercurialis annua]